MHKRILLVQLPTSHLGAGEKVYPLGLARLASTIPPAFERRALDMNLHPDPWPGLHRLLAEFQPGVVALSFRNLDPLAGHQASYLSVLKTAGLLVRGLLPEARILAGGPAFSLFGERLMAEVPQIDIGVVGEGEQVFPRLLEDHPPLAKLPGILYREGGRVAINPPGERCSLDLLPELDLASFPPAAYSAGNKYVAAMGIEGKRGCDLCCGYCLYPFLGGGRIRLRHPVAIVDEMERLHRECGITLFHFTDPVVNRPADHFDELCRELIRRRLPLSWTGFFREDEVTADNLALAVRAGLSCVYFSGDALTERGLRLLGKKLTPADIVRASRLTTELGLLTMCHFLVNLPGEGEAEIAEAGALLDQLLAIHAPKGNLGAVIFNHVRLYPGAPLTRKLIEGGLLAADTDLLYPVYYNPLRYNHVLHQLEARCHAAGVFSRLEAIS